MGAKDRSNKLLVVVAGPTGSGKTDIAISLAQNFHTEIVYADSRQIYKELSIGVGKPNTVQIDAAPHHLISHASIFEPYSAGHYATDALTIIHSLFAKHDIVILSGGTGLYIKSVIEGFDSMPQVPAHVTERWTNTWKEKGSAPLIAALKELDPDYLAIVDVDNHSRLIRAIAVSDHSGLPFSSFRKGKKTERFFKILPIVLDVPRQKLYERINQRVIEMIRHGWLTEAQELYEHRHLKAMQTVGYNELFDVIDGKLSLDEAIIKIQQSTRRYAKRQITWWRNQGQWNWVNPQNLDEMINMIENEKKLQDR